MIIHKVVVGHGTSPEGKGWGKLIDEGQTVIRMWNWNFQWDNPEDWGRRYDYGFYEIIPTEMARFYKHVVHRPTKAWIACKVSPPVKPYAGALPEPSIQFDSQRWENLGLRMGGAGVKGRLRLTRGARAAAWAMDRCIKGGTVMLVGFDNVHARIGLPVDQAFPAAYQASPAAFPLRDYKGGTTKYGNHDYAIEGPLLQELAYRSGIELLYAQDVW